AGRGLDHVAHRLHAFTVPGNTRQMTAFGPPAVAVHDNGHVLGELARVQLAEDFSLFTIQPGRNGCAQNLPLNVRNARSSIGGQSSVAAYYSHRTPIVSSRLAGEGLNSGFGGRFVSRAYR